MLVVLVIVRTSHADCVGDGGGAGGGGGGDGAAAAGRCTVRDSGALFVALIGCSSVLSGCRLWLWHA